MKPRRPAASPGPFGSLLLSLLGGSTDSETAEEAVDGSSGEEALIAVSFQSDGTLKLEGGSMSGQQNSWAPVRQDGNILTISQEIDGAACYDLRIEFPSDNEAVISMTYGDQVLSTGVFERGRADIVIGKHSVVLADATALSLRTEDHRLEARATLRD